MTRYALALAAALLAAPALAQDATFRYDSDNPEVEAKLTQKEEAFQEFFADDTEVRPTFRFTPQASAWQEKRLLRRSDQEFGEFNDIDADDLAELDTFRDDAPLGAKRVDKPGLLEKDFSFLDCPIGTVASVDETACVAGPDYVFD